MSRAKAKNASVSGRPRAHGESSPHPRDDVIAAATRLFAEQGYAATTMTRIAKETGLRPASLYYWFKDKEELLRATAGANRFAVSLVQDLERLDASAQIKLYRLLYEDTTSICLGLCDYIEIERLAHDRPTDFASFWSDYRLLYDTICELISDGLAEKAFVLYQDVGWTAATMLTIDEGVQKLYRYRHGPGPFEELPLPLPEPDVESYAHRSATSSLVMVLRDRSCLEDVRQQAMALPIEVPTSPDSLGRGNAH